MVSFIEDWFICRWLKSKPKYEEAIIKDSWTLSEGVCYLCGREDQPKLEHPTERSDFLFETLEYIGREFSEFNEIEKVGLKYLNLFIKTYEKGVRAIEGGCLQAVKEPGLRDGESYTRYWVKPAAFLEWAAEEKLIFDPLLIEIVNKNFLHKKRGPKTATYGENGQITESKLLDLLVELSNRPENRGKLTATKILELPEAKNVVDVFCRGKKSSSKDNKLDKVARKLRHHPDFGGFRRKSISK